MNPMIEAYKQSKKICLAANNLTFYIRKATGIKSNLIYYEEIIFFYVLNDITLNTNNYSTSIIIRIKEALLKVLGHTQTSDYRKYAEIFDIIIAGRERIYLDLFFKNNETFNPDFFFQAFMYQSELIVYIQENNTFMDIKHKPCSLSEWTQKAAVDDYYEKIVKLFNANFDMLLDFVTYNETLTE